MIYVPKGSNYKHSYIYIYIYIRTNSQLLRKPPVAKVYKSCISNPGTMKAATI